MNLIKKIKKNKLNITYIIVGGAIVAMSVTNCGRKGSRHGGNFNGGDYCENYSKGQSSQYVAASEPNSRRQNPTGYESQQHRYDCEDGQYTGSSWHGLRITTANPSGMETLRITDKDVFDGFLELLGVCGNTRWSGLHAQLVLGSYSCKSAINNLKLGFNIFMDYSPRQNSYAEADAYIWHKDLPQNLLDTLDPWIIQGGRFTRLNNSKEFEIIYNLFSERSTNLKVKVNRSPEDIEDCSNASVTISFADKPFARGSVFLSDARCYRQRH